MYYVLESSTLCRSFLLQFTELSLIESDPLSIFFSASLFIVCSLPGAFIFGPFTDMYGRKIAIQLFYLIMALGFGSTAFAQEVWHIFIGRSLCGFAKGFSISASIYVVEICNERQRSVIFAIDSALCGCGATLMYIIARYGPWHFVSGGFSLVCLCIFCAAFLIPESPQWLLKKGHEAKAFRILKKLGKNEAEIENELEYFRKSRKEETRKTSLKLLLERRVWKPFAILSIFHVLVSMSGIWDYVSYNVDFIINLDTSYNPLTVGIVLSCIRTAVNSSLGIYFIAKVSRKFAISLPGFLMGSGLLGAAIYEYYYRHLDKTQKPMQLIPILCIAIYNSAYLLGPIILPWTMAGEMFPLEVRGLMNGVTFFIGTLLIFVTVKLYIVRVSVMKMYEYLLSISVPCFALCLFGMFVLTETQNKTLREIEQGFSGEKKRLIKEKNLSKEGRIC